MGIGVGARAAVIAAVITTGLACNGSNAGDSGSSGVSSTGDDASSGKSTNTTTTTTTSSGTTSSTTDTTAPATDTGESASTGTTDASSSTTGPAPFCGDGVQDPGEACDDGDLQDDDACTTRCQLAVCGDASIQTGVEECDDGNQVDDDDCNNACISKYCTPTGQRAALDELAKNSASGCWNGNPCDNDHYSFLAVDGQNFQGFGEAISCTGAATCVAHVGIATFEDSVKCQGRWDVLCDDVMLGTIDTLGKVCIDSAMANGCSLDFEPRKCAQIELRAALDDDTNFKCCEGSGPDSMIVAVSAW
ncbi:MAG: DUF4215 domain-containing protein [Nannocystis sp.]|nr:DUF4215 domain-containing protein [Nannocystis sp.]